MAMMVEAKEGSWQSIIWTSPSVIILLGDLGRFEGCWDWIWTIAPFKIIILRPKKVRSLPLVTSIPFVPRASLIIAKGAKMANWHVLIPGAMINHIVWRRSTCPIGSDRSPAYSRLSLATMIERAHLVHCCPKVFGSGGWLFKIFWP